MISPQYKKEMLKQAVQQAFDGARTEPRSAFRQAIAKDPNNYKAWLWLAYTAENIQEKRAALYRAMLLNPTHEKTRTEYKRTLSPTHVQAAAQEHGAFICYSRADELFAVEIATQVKARKLPVWIDMLDTNDEADWHEQIRQALKRCGVMLLVLSPAMINDDDTRMELAYFLHAGKIVIPLLNRDCNWQALNLVHPPMDFRENPLQRLRIVFALLGIARQNPG